MLFPYPVVDVEDMNKTLVLNWNHIVGSTDMIFHLGDFCFGGTRITEWWESKLNGKIVHVLGNHDLRNGTKGISCGIIRFGGMNVFMCHQPPSPETVCSIVGAGNINLILCGHVHQYWKYHVENGIPIINVGADVWNFRPVSIRSIMKLYDRINRGKGYWLITEDLC